MDTRSSPEGTSIHHKVVMPISKGSKALTGKHGQPGTKKRHHAEDLQVNHSERSTHLCEDRSVLSSLSMNYSQLAESEIDVDASQTVSSACLSASEHDVDETLSTGDGHHDLVWEQAVSKARGAPDGETQSLLACTSALVSSNGMSTQPPVSKTRIHVMAEKVKKMTKPKIMQKGVKRKHTDEDKTMPDKNKKERKKQRKMAGKNYEISVKAKHLWEQLRRIDLPVEERQKLSTELYDIVKDKAKQLVFAHDTSRVVQCLFKYGIQEHKNALFEELKEEIVELCKSKYGKFFVTKLLKYGTKGQRSCVFSKLNGHVRKLLRHKEASALIELAYNDYANAQQRACLIEEFYGPSFALYKTPDLHNLEQIMKSHPEKCETILSNMKDFLSVLVDKSVLRHSLVHRLFLEYFTYASTTQKSEMIEVLREGVVEMLHTRDGAHVAMRCLWFGTAKDRKVLIKSFKPYILKIAQEEYGHLVLLALFDVVDDTKLVQKALLSELLKSSDELVSHQYGRKVILYLLSPRDPTHFHPDIVKMLSEGDGNPHSKKEQDIRRTELTTFISRPLIQYIAQNAEKLLIDKASGLLLLSALNHVKCEVSEAMRAIAEVAAVPFSAGDGSSQHIVEHPMGHLALKRLVQDDAQRMQEQQPVLFCNILLDILPSGSLKTWAACNRGCFILVSMLELKNESIEARVRKELSGVQKALKKCQFVGAQILLSRLNKES